MHKVRGSGLRVLKGLKDGLGFIEIVKGLGANKFSAKVFAETFSQKLLSRFLVLEPHFEFGPAWGLGLTGWGLWPGGWG